MLDRFVRGRSCGFADFVRTPKSATEPRRTAGIQNETLPYTIFSAKCVRSEVVTKVQRPTRSRYRRHRSKPVDDSPRETERFKCLTRTPAVSERARKHDSRPNVQAYLPGRGESKTVTRDRRGQGANGQIVRGFCTKIRRVTVFFFQRGRAPTHVQRIQIRARRLTWSYSTRGRVFFTERETLQTVPRV